LITVRRCRVIGIPGGESLEAAEDDIKIHPVSILVKVNLIQVEHAS
jgi:hypothetical protein